MKMFTPWKDKLSGTEVDLAILVKTREGRLRRYRTSMQSEINGAREARARGDQAGYQDAFDRLRQLMGQEAALHHQMKTLRAAEDTLSSISFQAESTNVLERIASLTQRMSKRMSVPRAAAALNKGLTARNRFLHQQELLGQLTDDLMEDSTTGISQQDVEKLINSSNINTDPVAQQIRQRIQELESTPSEKEI